MYSVHVPIIEKKILAETCDFQKKKALLILLPPFFTNTTPIPGKPEGW